MKYEKYEYFRISSIAKELYKRNAGIYKALREAADCKQTAEPAVCDCKNCITRKKNEHNRWNAYTRAIGFSYKDGVRADRALLHDDLRSWDDLSKQEKEKD